VDRVLGGQLDAITTDNVILAGYAAQHAGKLKVVGKPFSTEKYGIGLPKDDKALRKYVDDLLQKSFTDGTWQKIYDGTLGKSGSSAKPPKLERY
jgi:glutamate transport system substrate-binding protein